MRVNVERLKIYIKKATLNYSLESLQIILTKERVCSRMAAPQGKYVILLEIDNDIFMDVPTGTEYKFNFIEPNQNLLPFLNLIDDEETTLIVDDEKLTFKNGSQKSSVFFCSSTVVSIFGLTAPRAGINYFVQIPFNTEFSSYFNKIKKIGMKFGKVYFSVKDSVLLLESTDKLNRLSNGISFNIQSVEYIDLSLCFDFKDVSNLLAVLNGDVDNFVFNLAYLSDKNLGMIYIHNVDETEKYYLMSYLE